mgnify:FL=1
MTTYSYIIPLYRIHKMTRPNNSNGNSYDDGQYRTFAFDTCVIKKICDNRNLVSLLKCHIDFKNSTIFLNQKVVEEAQRKFGYDTGYILDVLRSSLPANVSYEEITPTMEIEAEYLKRDCEELHNGDSVILAFAVERNCILVSCDRALLRSCKQVGGECINPDIIAGTMRENISQTAGRSTKFGKRKNKRIAKPETVKPISVQMKAQFKKIKWEMFTK